MTQSTEALRAEFLETLTAQRDELRARLDRLQNVIHGDFVVQIGGVGCYLHARESGYGGGFGILGAVSWGKATAEYYARESTKQGVESTAVHFTQAVTDCLAQCEKTIAHLSK
jgi:hypothetical protein